MKLKPFLFIFPLLMLFVATSCPQEEPVELVGIELVNIDNSGKDMIESDGPVKKEAYAITIKYLVDSERFYSGAHYLGEYDYEYIQNVEGVPAKTIYCNTGFGTEYSEGSDVSSCFRICGDILLLNEVPVPGVYSFKVKLVYSNGLVFEADTKPVTLY